MKPWKLILLILLLITIVVWLAVLTFPDRKFKLIACDVGQGDSILAIYGNFQILTDGGNPNGKAVECLSRYMPFWDREIELIVNTHPEVDHFGGLIEVFKQYKVNYIAVSGISSSSQEFQVLEKEVGSSGTQVIEVSKGQSIWLGLMHLDILHPSVDYLSDNSSGNLAIQQFNNPTDVLGAYTTNKNKNDFSLVTVLSFKDFDALLTGDIEDKISDLIADEFDQRQKTNGQRQIEYLKVPHHGSKNGLSQKLVNILNPKIAVISLGKNSYGHPHDEVVKLLNDKNIKILRTDQIGDVIIETDGTNYKVIN